MTPAARTCATCAHGEPVYHGPNAPSWHFDYHTHCKRHDWMIADPAFRCHRYTPYPTAPARAETDDELR